MTSRNGAIVGTLRSRRVIGSFAILFLISPTFAIADWIYVSQHLLVLGIALTRPAPRAQDRSVPSSAAVIVSYAYPYAQLAYLRWVPATPRGLRVGSFPASSEHV
jgi:hypothetical protein